MQRVSECELVVFCVGGGQPYGLAAAQNISLHSEGFLIANGIRAWVWIFPAGGGKR
jgi:hypothetical protein